MSHAIILVNITHMEKKLVNKNCSWRSSNARFTKDFQSTITYVLKEIKECTRTTSHQTWNINKDMDYIF